MEDRPSRVFGFLSRLAEGVGLLRPTIELKVSRDDVHPADEWQEVTIRVPLDCPLSQALDLIEPKTFLPQFVNDRGTWIVQSDRPLAVVAQQWAAPAFIESPAARITELTAPEHRSIHFQCRGDDDPRLTYDCLRTSRPINHYFGR